MVKKKKRITELQKWSSQIGWLQTWDILYNTIFQAVLFLQLAGVPPSPRFHFGQCRKQVPRLRCILVRSGRVISFFQSATAASAVCSLKCPELPFPFGVCGERSDHWACLVVIGVRDKWTPKVYQGDERAADAPGEEDGSRKLHRISSLLIVICHVPQLVDAL